MCCFAYYFDLFQRLSMRGEVDGVCLGTSKRKRPNLEKCEGNNQVNSRVDSNCDCNGSGTFYQPMVRYRRTTRADNLAMSEVPNVVLEDVTNVNQFSDFKGTFNQPKVRYRRATRADNLAMSEVPKVVLEDVTNVNQFSNSKDAGTFNQPKVHYRRTTHADNLATSEVPKENSIIAQEQCKVLEMQVVSRMMKIISLMTLWHMVELQKMNITSRISAIVFSILRFWIQATPKGGPLGNEKKLTYRSVKMIRDLSHQFSSVHGKDKVKRCVGESSFSKQRQDLKENIDPVNIRGHEKDDVNACYYDTDA
ncbi:hypothetical protein RIF29_15370 [Crotalaria pallida]|uniref:Uncharacterized protein n=1 Tax=Crotalaria pallida TaxID=3830 RepID=A0AAN9FD13_CROPI